MLKQLLSNSGSGLVGAIFLVLLITVFTLILVWNFRKSKRKKFPEIAHLPLEEEEKWQKKK